MSTIRIDLDIVAADWARFGGAYYEDLSGTGAGSQVIRLRGVDESGHPRSVIAKRFPRDLERATVCGRLPGTNAFAQVLHVDREQHVVIFEDLGAVSLGSALADVTEGDTRSIRIYLDAVAAAHHDLESLRDLPQAPEDLTALAGFEAQSDWPAANLTFVGHLTAISDRSTALMAEAISRAQRAEHALVRRLVEFAPHRRWILADANPFNLVTSSGASPARWVDAVPVPGFAELNLVALGGASFRLTPDQAWSWCAPLSSLGERGLATMNGLYSLFTMVDTGYGLRSGSRDGGRDYAMSWPEVQRFSLEVARYYLGAGWPEADGLIGLVDSMLTEPHR